MAYILINIVPTKEKNVYNGLSKIEGVSEVHPLFGEYDVIVKVEQSNVDEIGRLVVEKIRSVEGIADTKTLAGARF